MNKREFLKYSVLAGAGLLASHWLLSGCSADQESAKNWIWSSTKESETDAELTERFAILRAVGITGIFFGGDSERHFRLAQAAGLETHLWMWTLNRGEDFIRENHPEWYSINRIGESCLDHPPYVDYYRWLCPSRKPVRDYLAAEVRKWAEKPYIQGIHLDYVRYCDVILPRALWEKYDLVQNEELPEFDYCYCDVCREAFQKATGEDPLQLDDPPSHAAWLQYRYDTVTRLVNELVEVSHEASKPISAAVFPSPAIARKLVRQDWQRWNLDFVCPMVYHSFYEEDIAWVGSTVQDGVEALPSSRPLYAGLYLPALPEPEDLAQAVQQAMDHGAAGVSLFGEVSDAHWQAFKTLQDQQR